MAETARMRALSIRPPWTTAIFKYEKHIENRAWSPSHRGLLAIHVTKGTGPHHEFEAAVTAVANRADVPEQVVRDESATRGAVIGVVDLFDVCSAALGGAAPSGLTQTAARTVVETAVSVGVTTLSVDDLTESRCRCGLWAAPDQHHLMFTNVRPLPVPVPAVGMLGLWTLDPATQAAVEQQLTVASRLEN